MIDQQKINFLFCFLFKKIPILKNEQKTTEKITKTRRIRA